jgi:hypothetical protein
MPTAIDLDVPTTTLHRAKERLDMAARVLTVVCAWCRCVVTAPPSAKGITHTICPTCLASIFDRPAPDPFTGPGVNDLDELRS